MSAAGIMSAAGKNCGEHSETHETRPGLPTRTLYIEVRINKTDDGFVRMDQIEHDVRQWLTTRPVVMRMNQEFTNDTDVLPDTYGARIESIKLVDATNFAKDTILFPLPRCESPDIVMPIMIYSLYPLDSMTSLGASLEDGAVMMGLGGGTQELPDARIYPLPNAAFHGLWESLVFDEQLPRRLLRTIIRMEDVSSKLMNTWAMNWNRLVLLYGPPGTGKTSLCRAISQRLAIRYAGSHQVQLVEMNAQSLASRFFGESGKLVQKMFEAIEAMLQEDEDRFVVVLVDEIETLTTKRESSLSGGEPIDGMKAVNALLTGLDRIKNFRNVIILCTTNLITALDSAFMDRVDIKQEVPLPSKKVIYEILRSGYNALQSNGILIPFHMARSRLPEDHSTPVFEDYLPPYALVGMVFWNQASMPMRLVGIAEKAVGLSGRTLRRLPALSLVYSDEDEVVTLAQAFVALEKAVNAEITARKQAGELGMSGKGVEAQIA